jgi:hypothetical protein
MARKSRERKQKKPRLASHHAVNLALARADGILSRSKKIGTMTASDKGIAIAPDTSDWDEHGPPATEEDKARWHTS